MKTNQPTTKLSSIEEVLREFREKFLTPIKLKYVPDAIVFGIRPERDQIAIEAFIRAALTKIQRDTREETIREARSLTVADILIATGAAMQEPDPWKQVANLRDFLLDRLKSVKIEAKT